MSLIERLHRDDWREMLRRTFEIALDVLTRDQFQPCSSAVDDLRNWLAVGGISRVKEHLRTQAESLRFPDAHRRAIDEHVDQLALEHRGTIIDLVGRGIITPPPQEVWSLFGLSEDELKDMMTRARRGDQPFLERMRALGCSDDEIERLLGLVDQWLAGTDRASIRGTSGMN